jgi:hypothetical protein
LIMNPKSGNIFSWSILSQTRSSFLIIWVVFQKSVCMETAS